MAFVAFVDDEPIRPYIREIERRGHMVQQYYARQDFLEEVRDGLECDVVFVDRSLPDIDGDALIHLLRRQLPSATIVCVSGYYPNEFLKKSAAAPYDHYLSKEAGLRQ